MRQTLFDDWSLEIPPSFSRSGKAGIIIFENGRISISATLFLDLEQPCPAEEMPINAGSRDRTFEFRTVPDDLIGHAVLSEGDRGYTLLAAVCSFGRTANLECRFINYASLESVISICRSLRYSPPSWFHRLSESDNAMRMLRESLVSGLHIEDAVQAVHNHDQLPVIREAILGALQSESVTVRESACKVLGQIDDATSNAVSSLRTMLLDSSARVQASAATSLLLMGEVAESIVPHMIAALEQSEGAMLKGNDRIQGDCGILSVPERYYAAQVLSKIGRAAHAARNALLNHQMDESGDVRIRVADALANIGEPSTVVIPPLLDGLRSADMADRERVRLAKALLQRGMPDVEVIPTLIDLLKGSADTSAKLECLKVIASLGSKALSAADAVAKVALDRSRNNAARVRAARTLIHIGGDSAIACPILLAALDQDKYQSCKADIIYDIALAPHLSESTLDRIDREVKCDNVAVRVAAAFAIARHRRTPDSS